MSLLIFQLNYKSTLYKITKSGRNENESAHSTHHHHTFQLLLYYYKPKLAWFCFAGNNCQSNISPGTISTCNFCHYDVCPTSIQVTWKIKRDMCLENNHPLSFDSLSHISFPRT